MTYLTTSSEVNELPDHYEFKFAPTTFTFNAATLRLMNFFNWKSAAIVYDFLDAGGLYVKVWPKTNKLNKYISFITYFIISKC